MIHQIRLIIALVLLPLISNIKLVTWTGMSDTERMRASDEMKAFICDMEVDEFRLMSAVVEAESDRNPDHTEGKKLIALTIFNRKEDEDFPNSVTGVISQAGQFQVYYEGTYQSTGRTEGSDEAVIDAYFWQKDEHPDVQYFNSIGFMSGFEAYAYVDGNYFSLGG